MTPKPRPLLGLRHARRGSWYLPAPHPRRLAHRRDHPGRVPTLLSPREPIPCPAAAGNTLAAPALAQPAQARRMNPGMAHQAPSERRIARRATLTANNKRKTRPPAVSRAIVPGFQQQTAGRARTIWSSTLTTCRPERLKMPFNSGEGPFQPPHDTPSHRQAQRFPASGRTRRS